MEHLLQVMSNKYFVFCLLTIMHSQMVRPQAHSFEQHAGGDENEQHHEKKSVLKKVKAKAKKIKDTLKLHGQGHHDDQGYRNLDDTPDDHDLDEEEKDDDDDEMAIDPEIHGTTDSTTTRSYVPEQVATLGDTRNYYGSLAAKEDQRAFPGYSKPQGGTDLLKQEEDDQGNKVSIERTSNIKDVPFTPLSSPAPVAAPRINVEQPKAVNPIERYSMEEEAIRGKSAISMKNSVRFEEDPDAPKSRTEQEIPTNYQTKAVDPTGQGTKEIEASSILHKLGQLGISEESKPGRELDSRQRDQSIFPTGSHDQFSPEPSPPMPLVSDEVPQSLAHKSNASKSEDRPSEKGQLQSSYTKKISSATSAIADKVINAKNVVASKLGYGVRGNAKEHDEPEKSKATSPVVYGKKIVEKFTPVYEKVAETGSNLMSKAHGTGSQMEGQDKGVSVRDYFSEKLKPGEEDRALSEVISEALYNKQKRETEKTEKKMGKVTESEEVKKRLGSTEENLEERVDETDVNTTGSAVVGKIKEVVGSLLGEGEKEETRSSSQH